MATRIVHGNTKAASGEVRIIGGQWKRSKLPVPAWPGLRPTPARVRETLFNWLGQDLTGWRCLDAFAGSGALGFEAASRGAAQVTLVEREAKLAVNLQAACAKLQARQVHVVNSDALAFMAQCSSASFDLVLLDPPFGADLFITSLKAALQVVVPGGAVYLEANKPIEPPLGLSRYRQAKAASVYYHLFMAANG